LPYNSLVPDSAPTTAAVITVSDSCFRGQLTDLSGPAVATALRSLGFAPLPPQLVPDEIDALVDAMRAAAAQHPLIITTGGTGIGPRDITPEATRILCSRILEGMAERMRIEGAKQTPLAALSRAVCGTAGHALIINLPGNPDGAVASLHAVAPLIPHALELLAGHTTHAHDQRSDQSRHARVEHAAPPASTSPVKS
jgi:molybdopterin adenylyltransferase